jgi:hypothetical protein
MTTSFCAAIFLATALSLPQVAGCAPKLNKFFFRIFTVRPPAGRTLRLVGESLLETLRVDISDNDVPAAVEKIVDWMEASGGLWLE